MSTAHAPELDTVSRRIEAQSAHLGAVETTVADLAGRLRRTEDELRHAHDDIEALRRLVAGQWALLTGILDRLDQRCRAAPEAATSPQTSAAGETAAETLVDASASPAASEKRTEPIGSSRP